MRRTILGITLLLVIATSMSALPEESLWQWSEKCGGNNAMELEVLVDGITIYRSSIPICRMSNRAGTSESHTEAISYYFRGGHVFGEYHTVRTQTIEGNVWQAGSDPDELLLGISFSTKKQVLLNTIHIAKPGRVSSSEVDRGIVVRTFPILRK